MMKNFKKSIAIFSAMVAIMSILLLPSSVLASDSISFRSGDIVTAVNNTTRSADWADVVNADPGNVIEFRMVVQNMTPNSVAKDVLVWANFPQIASKSPQMGMTATANGSKVYDTATVNVSDGMTHLIDYVSGHTRVFSPSCPDGCNADDTFLHGTPINVGDLAYGESAQVLFKASVNRPIASPSPSPSATATPKPTVTPTPSPSSTPNPSSSPKVVSTAPPSATSLPKTGAPLAGLALAGLLPVGAGIRRFGKKAVQTLSANSLWEDREMKK